MNKNQEYFDNLRSKFNELKKLKNHEILSILNKDDEINKELYSISHYPKEIIDNIPNHIPKEYSHNKIETITTRATYMLYHFNKETINSIRELIRTGKPVTISLNKK